MTLDALRGIYWSISTFGLHVFYYRRWGMKQEDEEPRSSPIHADPLSLRRSTWRTPEWTKSVASMSAIWRLVGFACGILLPYVQFYLLFSMYNLIDRLTYSLSIAFLQVNGVADNVRTRTFTLASSVFASSGLLCSGLYLCEESSRFCNSKLSAKWVEVSFSFLFFEPTIVIRAQIYVYRRLEPHILPNQLNFGRYWRCLLLH